MTTHTHLKRSRPRHERGSARFLLTTVVVLGLVLAAIWFGFLRKPGAEATDVPLTAPLARGSLRVTVSESGNLESLHSHSILNLVEGRTTIDYIIPEGTILTERDVQDGTVLVRLNGAALEEKRVRQELEVSSAADSRANAVTGLEIQLQQNASDERKADLDVRFANLDLERYVGKAFAGQLLSAYEAAMAPPERTVEGEGGQKRGLDGTRLRRLIGSLLESDALEGEALQRIRTLKSDIHLADEKHRRAAEKLKHTVRLEEKGYVSRDSLEADQLALDQREIEMQRTRTARDQFVAYDFPKEVAKLISGVVEAKDRKSRALKKAQAAEAQKRSAVKNRERQLLLKKERLQDLVGQEKGLVIKATVPGLVVYSSSGSGHRRRNDERIDEGSSVRQGQTLIKIPDDNSLGVVTKVHESAIRNLKEGLSATVEVEALPGSRLPARVSKVKRMPDAASWWENPDLKVYHTELRLLGGHPTLKPGMSAEVEILITTLQDVIAAPVQAVAGTADKPAVFVWVDGEPERRDVVLGLASEHFVEIKSGLEGGERLLLDPPREEATTTGAGTTPGAESDGAPPKGGAAKGGAKDGMPRGGAKTSGSGRKGMPRGASAAKGAGASTPSGAGGRSRWKGKGRPSKTGTTRGGDQGKGQ